MAVITEYNESSSGLMSAGSVLAKENPQQRAMVLCMALEFVTGVGTADHIRLADLGPKLSAGIFSPFGAGLRRRNAYRRVQL